MKDRYNKKNVQTFKVGDAVSVQMPRIDRAATGLHRLPCIVVARYGNKHFQYRLLCKYGLLESFYPESELKAFAGAQQMRYIHDWEEAPVVSLREAATVGVKKRSPFNPYYGRPFKKTGGERGMNGNGTGDEQNGPFCTYASRFILIFLFPFSRVICASAFTRKLYYIYVLYVYTRDRIYAASIIVFEPVAFTRSKNLATPRLLTKIPSLSNILAIVGGR